MLDQLNDIGSTHTVVLTTGSCSSSLLVEGGGPAMAIQASLASLLD